jgi:metal-sulfur cluster biosynthetic enzyme
VTEDIKSQIIKNLREVYDPEISINIYDLGLIYDIDLTQLPKVKITHTLTSAFCPSADEIIWGIRQATMMEGVDECEVITTFDPPFSLDMLSDEVKLEIGIGLTIKALKTKEP